jgi:hypothetical protein
LHTCSRICVTTSDNLHLTESLCLWIQEARKQTIEHSVLLVEDSISYIKFKVWTCLDLVTLMASSAITGLVVDSDNVPNFERDSDEAYVNDNWADNRWNDNSVVRFRDCSIKISASLPACDRFQIIWSRAAGRPG